MNTLQNGSETCSTEDEWAAKAELGTHPATTFWPSGVHCMPRIDRRRHGRITAHKCRKHRCSDYLPLHRSIDLNLLLLSGAWHSFKLLTRVYTTRGSGIWALKKWHKSIRSMGLLKMQHLHEVQNVRMRWSYVLVLLVMSLCCNAPVVESLPNCSYPALYNFGDSLSDVGNAIAAFPTQFKHAEMAPNGYQFPMHGADRLSDGKLFVDFMGMIYVHSALFSCISLLKVSHCTLIIWHQGLLNLCLPKLQCKQATSPLWKMQDLCCAWKISHCVLRRYA